MIPHRIADATGEHERILNAVIQGETAKLHEEVMAHREKTLTNWRALARAEADGAVVKLESQTPPVRTRRPAAVE